MASKPRSQKQAVANKKQLSLPMFVQAAPAWKPQFHPPERWQPASPHEYGKEIVAIESRGGTRTLPICERNDDVVVARWPNGAGLVEFNIKTGTAVRKGFGWKLSPEDVAWFRQNPPSTPELAQLIRGDELIEEVHGLALFPLAGKPPES